MAQISGRADYFFDDEFIDTLGVRERSIGTSDPEKAGRLERLITDGFGTYFPVRESWKWRFAAEARFNRQTSIYRWD